MLGPQQQVRPVAIAQADQLGGTEHVVIGDHLLERGGEAVEEGHRRLGVRRVDEHAHQAAERRVAQRLAPGQLAVEELVNRMPGGQAHDALSGIPGLQEHASARALAPRAAGQLREQRKGALLSAKVGHREAEIGVDHRREADIWEVMALGDDLRPDQHGAIGRPERRQHLLERADARGDVTVEPQDGQAGEPLGDLALEPLRARTDAGDVDGPAVRALGRRRLGVAAVVADEARRPLVQHERDVAGRAAEALATGPAVEREGGAAAVEQNHRPAPVTLDVAQRRRQRARQWVVAIAREVDEFDRRQATADALGQRDAFKRLPGLRARCRRREDDGRAGSTGAHQRHGASVVARVGLLLVRDLVLLVDHDQAEVAQRRQDRRARADQHTRLPALEALPDPCPLALRQPRVQHLDESTKAPPHARRRLGSQRDLGHEDDHATALLERVCCRPQEDLGLAGAGDTVEQQLAAARPTVDGLLETGDGRLLGLRRGERGLEVRWWRGDLSQAAVGDQLAHGGRSGARPRGDVAERAGGVTRGAEDRSLPRPAGLRPVGDREPGIRWRRVALRRQDEFERARRRRGVALGDLQREVDQLGRHTRARVHGRLEGDPGRDVLGRGCAQHDTLLLPAAERNRHHGPDGQRARIRQRSLQPARRDERADDDGVRARRGARRPCLCAPS